MGRSIVNVEIDGHKYRIKKFGAWQGTDILFRITKLGAVSAGAIESAEGEGSFGKVVSDLFAKADPNDVRWILEQMASGTQYIEVGTTGIEVPKDLSDIFDDHFADEYYRMCLWLGESMKVNFSNFLEELKVKGKKLFEERGKEILAKLSKSQKG